MKEIQDQGLGRGSPEFFFQSPKVTPWSPVDSLTILKFVEFMSSNKALTEIKLTSLIFSSAIDDKIKHLISDPGLLRSKLDEVILNLRKQQFDERKKDKYASYNGFFTPPNAGFYSNVFAADGSRTASKKSLLSTNLFLPLSSPSLWMLAHLDLKETSVVGATVPGIPIIFSGKNSKLAWGSSFSFIDDQDLYFEKINSANKNEYLSPSGYKRFSNQKKLINLEKSLLIPVVFQKNSEKNLGLI